MSVVEYATSAGLGPMATTPPLSALTYEVRQVELAFAGTLVTGGVIRLAITGTVRHGPGTPGCTTDAAPAPTCSTAAPQGRTLLLGVSHIAEQGDPDSDFCARGDLRTCPTALHDKRREPDAVDPAGHNIAAQLGGTQDYNLRMVYQRVGTRPGTGLPPVTVIRRGEQDRRPRQCRRPRSHASQARLPEPRPRTTTRGCCSSPLNRTPV